MFSMKYRTLIFIVLMISAVSVLPYAGLRGELKAMNAKYLIILSAACMDQLNMKAVLRNWQPPEELNGRVDLWNKAKDNIMKECDAI